DCRVGERGTGGRRADDRGGCDRARRRGGTRRGRRRRGGRRIAARRRYTAAAAPATASRQQQCGQARERAGARPRRGPPGSNCHRRNPPELAGRRPSATGRSLSVREDIPPRAPCDTPSQHDRGPLRDVPHPGRDPGQPTHPIGVGRSPPRPGRPGSSAIAHLSPRRARAARPRLGSPAARDREGDSMNAERMWEAWRQALRASAGTLARTMLVAALAIGLGTGPAHADPAAESHYAAVLLATVQSTEKLDELVVDILATRLGPEKHAIARRMLVKLFTHPAMPAFVARTGAEWGSSPSASQSREAMEISVSILRLAGMRRLAPEHQRQFIDQMASKLQHASEQVCHELRENRRGAFDSLEREHLRRIGLDEFAAFIRLAEMSALAELADEPKPANLSEEQLRRAGEAF